MYGYDLDFELHAIYEIIDHNDKSEYLVKWEYTQNFIVDLIDCKKLVENYHKKNKLEPPVFPSLEECDDEYHQRYSFEVKSILDFDKETGYYAIEWQDSWVHREDLLNCRPKICEYKKKLRTIASSNLALLENNELENSTDHENEQQQQQQQPEIPANSVANFYVCNVCSQRIYHKKNIKRHHETHNSTGYGCGICKKIYSRKDDLKRHFNLHIDPIKCNECNQQFTRKSDLNRHIKAKHNICEPKFICNNCSLTFSRLDSLKRHNLNKH